MSKPKLTYFDFPGSRGEEVRLALWIAGVDFEDKRLAFNEWAELKPSTPFGSLPVLELEGRDPLGQSAAILAYIGREYGLHPSESWAAARHEALLAAGEELRGVVVPVLRIKDEAASKAAREELAAGYLPAWGKFIDNQLEQLGADPFVGGKELNVADLKLYMCSKWFTSGGVDHVPAEVFEGCDRLLRLQQAVAEHPKVVAWYAR